MKTPWLLAGLALIACGDLTGPTGWLGNYGTYDLVAWDAESVPTGFDAVNSRIVKGCIFLREHTFLDTYVTEYPVNGAQQLHTDSTKGTWELATDSLVFKDGTETYTALLDTLQHSFVLTWYNYDSVTKTFVSHSYHYQRKGTCR